MMTERDIPHWIMPIVLPGNVEVDVRVDRQGKFSATWNGMDFDADTRAGVEDKVKAAERKTSKVKIDFPFTIIDYNGVPENVTATGIHGGSGNVTYRTGTKTQQADSYYGGSGRGGKYYRRLAAEEVEWLADMRANLAAVQGHIDGFLDERRIDLKAEVQRRIAEKEAGSDGQ